LTEVQGLLKAKETRDAEGKGKRREKSRRRQTREETKQGAAPEEARRRGDRDQREDNAMARMQTNR